MEVIDQRFESSGIRGFYRPVGAVSAEQVVYMINGALARARELGLREIVVNLREIGELESPGREYRRWAVRIWSATAAPYLRVAVVARHEHICPRRSGILAAAEEGLRAEVFEAEADAVAWLDAGRDAQADPGEPAGRAARRSNGERKGRRSSSRGNGLAGSPEGGRKLLTIGIYGDATDEALHRAVLGVIKYCKEAGGFHVRDFRMREMVQEIDRHPPPWRGRADGLLVSMGVKQWTARELADWVVSGGVPATVIGLDWFDPRIPPYYIDPATIAECAADHLVQCGCASFLYFGHAKSPGSAVRGQAFRQALVERGSRCAEYDTDHAYLGGLEDEGDIKAEARLAELLREARKPLGVYAVNDFFAAAAVLLCRELGLRVPEDVRVLGTEDTFAARSNDPPLSSIRCCREELGYAAMAGLHAIMRGEPGPTKPTAVRGTTTVVPRVSTVGAQEAIGSVDDIRRYIEDRACQGVSVDELVQMVGVSRRTFEQWFREHFGRTPREEVQRVRLEKAKELLGSSELSVTRVASMVGFEEAASFSKFFRTGTGFTPREFRLNASGGGVTEMVE